MSSYLKKKRSASDFTQQTFHDISPTQILYMIYKMCFFKQNGACDLQKMWCVLWEWLMNNASCKGLSENRVPPNKKRSFGYFSCSNTPAMFVISFSWLEWPVARVPWEAQDHTKGPHVGCRAVFLAASDTPRDEYQPVIWWCEAMPQIDLRWFKNYWPLFRRGSLPQGSWCSIFGAVV